MIHLVEEAQEQKGKTQLFIERFGRRYTPAVLLVSLILIVVPPFFGIPFNDLAIRGVVLLVAAAPCALVMSRRSPLQRVLVRQGNTGFSSKAVPTWRISGRRRRSRSTRPGHSRPVLR